MKYRIGKTIAVQGDTIEMLLEEPRRDAEGIESGVPANMTVAFDQPPRSLVIGQPGSFVEMAIPTGGLLGVVIACRLLDPTKAFQESSVGARLGSVGDRDARPARPVRSRLGRVADGRHGRLCGSA